MPSTSDAAEKKRILLVDDEPAVRTVTHRFLWKSYDVTAAASADEALALLHSRPPEYFQLLICDCNMPGTDGIELLRQVGIGWPDLRRFVLSGTLTADRRQWLEQQRIPCLGKPCDRDDLLSVVDEVLSAPPP